MTQKTNPITDSQRKAFGQIFSEHGNGDTANELRLMRESIDTLVVLLSKPKSIIIAGAEAERIFDAMKGGER